MEQKATSAKSIMINFGLVLGIISVFIGVVNYVTGTYLDRNWITGTIGFLASVLIYVWGINTFKKGNGGYLKLTQALKIGMGIALIAGIIGAIWQLVLMTVLVPDFVDQVVNLQIEAALESGRATEAQLDQSRGIMRKLSGPAIYVPIVIIITLFFGFIISLIAGLIMKKENPYEDA